MNGTEEELKLKSPLRMVIIIAVSVFVIEAAIMFLLPFLPPLPYLLDGLIDASAITILLSPVIYYLIFRPMTSYIAEIRSARDLIKDEKAKIEAIITGSQDAIIMMDSRGVITFWNPASEKMFGFTRDEALDRILHELIVPERFRNDALKGHQAFKDTGEGPLIGVILEHAGLRKDGTEFYAEHSISALKVKGEWHALGIVRDITERKQKETVVRGLLEKTEQGQKEVSALLEASRAVLQYRTFKEAARALFDSCKDVIGATAGYVALLSKDGTENEVLFLDAGGRPCTVDTALPMPIRGLRAESYHSGKAVYDNDFANSEWMKFMPEGHVILDNVLFAPLHIDGQTVGLIGLANKPGGFTDNDSRLVSSFGDLASIALINSRAAEALAESEEKYRTIIEHSGDMIWTLDTEGRFIFANKRTEEISGYKIEDWVGKPFAPLIAEGLPKIMEVFQKILKGEAREFEVTIIHADGRLVVLAVNAAPSYSGKQVTGTVSFGRDITASKQAEKELLERIDELERFRKATVQREFRIKELRDENEELKRKMGIKK